MSRSFPQTHSDKPLGGRYKVISRLGIGGFGHTFLADDLHLPGHPRCVVKQLKPQTKSEATFEMARRCFHVEAETLYQLGDHDQIPRLLAHFEENHEFYLAQEYIEGDSLAQELVDGKPWAENRVILLLNDILHVLTFVHQQQVIHRDIKPSNLIRRRHDGKVVLIDFGAVKQASTQTFDPDTGITNLTISIGTQGYMPNEQLAGKPRFSSDVHAVGVIGIQALTGVHPKHFGEDVRGEIEWHHRATHASPALIAILDRMVRYDFRDRYPTAREALAALHSLPMAIAHSYPSYDLVPDTIVQNRESEESEESEPVSSHSDSQPAPSGGQEVEAVEWSMPEMDSSPTALWTSTEALPSPHPTPNITGTTEAVGRPYAPAPPPPSRWRILRHQLSHPGVFLVVILVLGGTTTLVRTLVLPWLTHSFSPTFPLAQPGSPLPPLETLAPSVLPLSPAEQAQKLVEMAKLLQAKTQYEEALSQYEEAIALQPDLADAYAGRCETLNRLNRAEEAIVACNDALAYKPGYPEALWSKGNALLLQNRVFEALKLYEEVTALKPGFAEGWVRRGVALQRLGRSAEALTALNRSIELHRNSVEAWKTQGAALLTLRRYDEAIAALDKALQLAPNDADILKLRQQVREQSGR